MFQSFMKKYFLFFSTQIICNVKTMLLRSKLNIEPLFSTRSLPYILFLNKKKNYVILGSDHFVTFCLFVLSIKQLCTVVISPVFLNYIMIDQ